MDAQNYIETMENVKDTTFASDYAREISQEFERDSRRYIREFSDEREVL